MCSLGTHCHRRCVIPSAELSQPHSHLRATHAYQMVTEWTRPIRHTHGLRLLDHPRHMYNFRDEAGTTTVLDGETSLTCSSRSLYIKVIRPCPAFPAGRPVSQYCNARRKRTKLMHYTATISRWMTGPCRRRWPSYTCCSSTYIMYAN